MIGLGHRVIAVPLTQEGWPLVVLVKYLRWDVLISLSFCQDELGASSASHCSFWEDRAKRGPLPTQGLLPASVFQMLHPDLGFPHGSVFRRADLDTVGLLPIVLHHRIGSCPVAAILPPSFQVIEVQRSPEVDYVARSEVNWRSLPLQRSLVLLVSPLNVPIVEISKADPFSVGIQMGQVETVDPRGGLSVLSQLNLMLRVWRSSLFFSSFDPTPEVQLVPEIIGLSSLRGQF